jgi:two-component system, sensor histidine kinase RpfC
LRYATSQSIRARDAQSRFIGTVSHEFRTPLNSLTNCALLIDPGRLVDEDQTLLRAVSYNAHALLHRVNNVLDFAAIDAGQLRLQPAPMQVNELMSAVYAVCNVQTTGKIHLGIDVTKQADIVVVGDAGRMEQVLTNLVSNAVKFTAEGTVMLTVKRIESGMPDVANLQFEVADTGIGIPKDKQAEIFEPFRQLAQELDRAYGGVGLGLYVVRSISDLMDGKLQVDDNPGGGSVFTWTVRLPMAQNQSRTSGTSILDALAVHRATFRPLHCVVFEDTPSNQLILERMLELAGHTVTFHDRGEDAWVKIEQARADLVFLDLHMPGVSGLDVLHDIAQKREKKCTPALIVLTADVTESAAEALRAAGISEYLTKPLSATKLLSTIERLYPTLARTSSFTPASAELPN